MIESIDAGADIAPTAARTQNVTSGSFRARADGIRTPKNSDPSFLPEGGVHAQSQVMSDRMPLWADLSHEQKLQVIRNGIDANLSASQIARPYPDCTRNVIIGLASRNKIPLSTQKGGMRRAALTAKPVLPKRPAKRRLAAPRPEAAEPKEMLDPIPEPDLELDLVTDEPSVTNIHFMKATEATCRWPMWPHHMGTNIQTPFAELLICGARTEEGSPYCAIHDRRAHHVSGAAQ